MHVPAAELVCRRSWLVDVVTGLGPQIIWSEHRVGWLHIGGVVVVVERLRSGHHQS